MVKKNKLFSNFYELKANQIMDKWFEDVDDLKEKISEKKDKKTEEKEEKE